MISCCSKGPDGWWHFVMGQANEAEIGWARVCDQSSSKQEGRKMEKAIRREIGERKIDGVTSHHHHHCWLLLVHCMTKIFHARALCFFNFEDYSTIFGVMS